MKTLSKVTLLVSLGTLLSACSGLNDPQYSWCKPEPQVEKINLAADALFKFDQSDVKDLLPQGKQSLDELAQKLVSQYATVDSIDLIGHTDRLGSDAYNQDLGLRRAKTVKAYLQSKGVNAPMSESSAGESQPVTTHCVGDKATVTLTACLQPDRRVEVKIMGVRKGK